MIFVTGSNILQVRLNESQDEQLLKLRCEFLARCFCRLVVIESMPQALYNLGSSLWSYEMDVLRLLHVYALVENGDRDNEIEELVPKVCVACFYNVPNLMCLYIL